MASNIRYHLKFSSEGILMDTVNAIAFSETGRFLAAADSRGNLVTFDTSIGRPVHLAYLVSQTQIHCLAWISETELFFGCNNGSVASIAVVKAGAEVSLCATPCSFKLTVIVSSRFKPLKLFPTQFVPRYRAWRTPVGLTVDSPSPSRTRLSSGSVKVRVPRSTSLILLISRPRWRSLESLETLLNAAYE